MTGGHSHAAIFSVSRWLRRDYTRTAAKFEAAYLNTKGQPGAVVLSRRLLRGSSGWRSPSESRSSLFTFATFPGAATHTEVAPIACGSIALLDLFVPDLLLMVAALTFWPELRKSRVTHGFKGCILGAFFRSQRVIAGFRREIRQAQSSLG